MFAEDRAWKSEDVTFLSALARHTAQALERARLFERAEEARRDAEQAVTSKEQSLALLDTLLASAPVGFAFVDRELRYRRVNPVLAMLGGAPRDEHFGRTVREVLPPAMADQIEPILRGVLASGEAVVDLPISGETPTAPGELRHFRANYYPVRLVDPSGSGEPFIVGVGIVVIDVTAQKRASDAVALLAEASAILSSSLDYERTLSELARVAVPRLGDWCAVDVIERGESRLVAVAHTDPSKIDLALELRRRYPPLPDQPGSVFDVARSAALAAGRRRSTTRCWWPRARDAEHLRLARQLGPRSVIVVPLVAAGRGFGALTLVAAESGRRYGPADLAVAEELAQPRRAGGRERAPLRRRAGRRARARGVPVDRRARAQDPAHRAQAAARRPGALRPARGRDRQAGGAASRLEGTLRQIERLEKLVEPAARRLAHRRRAPDAGPRGGRPGRAGRARWAPASPTRPRARLDAARSRPPAGDRPLGPRCASSRW